MAQSTSLPSQSASIEESPNTVIQQDRHQQQERNRKGVKRATNRSSGDGLTGDVRKGSSGSVLFTVLLIGLVFSLIDVVYMMHLVNNYQQFGPVPSKFEDVQALSDKKGTERKQEAPNTDHRPNNRDRNTNALKDGKKPILDLIRRASLDPAKFDDDTLDALPTWEEVVGMYGPEPVIVGLDQCETFQEQTQKMGFVGAAGTFNSGTNLMAELLIANCHIQTRMDKLGSQNRGIRWQVPWGKHTPPGDEEFIREHKTTKDANVDSKLILPAVTVRDPLTWLISMCNHPYAARWDHEKDGRCPDFSESNLKTTVKYAEFNREHKSILDLWNDYYREYLEVSFPRLLVRIEDLIFHPEETVTSICKCAGGSMRKDGKFQYVLNSAKKGEHAHGKERTGFVDGLIKYGSVTKRYENYHYASDLEYIRENIDPELFKLLAYTLPDPFKATIQAS